MTTTTTTITITTTRPTCLQHLRLSTTTITTKDNSSTTVVNTLSPQTPTLNRVFKCSVLTAPQQVNGLEEEENMEENPPMELKGAEGAGREEESDGAPGPSRPARTPPPSHDEERAGS